MIEDFIERLDRYMEYAGLNDNRVTVQSGITIGLINSARKRGKSMSGDNIGKILYAHKELNARWLLTGEGEMLATEENKPNHELIEELKRLKLNHDEMKKDRDEWFFKARKYEEELQKYTSSVKTDEAV